MSHTCNRRQFLKGVAGVTGGMMLAGLPLPEGARAATVPAPQWLPARRTPPEAARIAFVKTTDRAAGPVTVGDRSGMGHSRDVMQRAGVFAMAEELGFETLVFEDLTAVEDWEWFQVEGGHWQQGFPVARPVLDADGVVSLCCLKTHRYGGHFTLSLKNSVGMVAKVVPDAGGYNYMTELHDTVHQRRMIAEINAAYDPALIVMDGVEAFINGGPATGELADGQVVLAGTDRVAMDALGVALLRYLGTRETAVASGPIFAQEQIARAVELGLGVDGPDKIEIITDDPASAEYAARVQDILLSTS